MYWWINRRYTESDWIFWDGKETSIKNTIEAKEAREWFVKIKDKIDSIEIKRPPNKTIKIKIPLGEWEWEVDNEFDDWVVNSKLETKLSYILLQILDWYFLGKEWLFYIREKS